MPGAKYKKTEFEEITASIVTTHGRLDKKVPAICEVLGVSCGIDESVNLFLQEEGGTVRGERGDGDVVAYIHNTSVIDSQNNGFCCSVCRTDCTITCKTTTFLYVVNPATLSEIH